jgi:TatD DNase family protein
MDIVIDSHAHLDEVENLGQAIDTSKNSGVLAIICVGQSSESNEKVLEIAAHYPGYVFPALGLHPWNIHELLEPQIEQTLAQIESGIADAVAIGEIGLDYDKRVLKLTNKDTQKIIFRRLMDIAVRNGKPVSVHSRYAWKDCLDIVLESGAKKVVFHWFTGLSSTIRDIIDAGYYVSATPAAEYHEEHRRAIKEAPLERLLLETDCPVVYRGKQEHSQPADVMRSLKAVAELKGLSEAEIAHKTTENAIELFGLGKMIA